jgi:heme/copper-type cytochrome/quinol oxidase subunit 2
MEQYNQLFITLIILAAIVLFAWIIFLIKHWPRRPDPWDKEDFEDDSQALPVCTNCLTPVESPFRHYCKNCGNAVGKFTPYIPFVNIPFNYSIFSTIWRKANEKQTLLFWRILFYLIVLFLLVPPLVALVISVLAVIWMLFNGLYY